MQNTVIRHFVQNKVDYTIGAIVLFLIGLGLFQAISMPSFDDSNLSRNVADAVTGEKPVTFVEERHFNVTRGEEVTFMLKSVPHRRVDYFLVHPDRRVRALHQESSTTDSSGLTTYTGQINDRIQAGVTYDVGVQVTLPNKGKKVLVLAPYSVTLSSEKAAGSSSTEPTFNN